MFKNPVKPSKNIDEGTVLQVDPTRLVCKVQTISGQNLDGVQWLLPVGGSSRSGDRVCPTLGDRVKIDYGLGYPVITGCLPRMQTVDNKFPTSIDTGQTLVNTGNYTSDGVNAIGDQNKPRDMLVGDRILASSGGGLMAVLRGGSLLLRSSRLSEIFISKWDDVVRITSRNWEHFTDVSGDIIKNLRGRVYRYIGYASSFANSKIEAYNYHLYYGDTAAAEAVKTKYQSPPTIPAVNTTIFKEQVTDTTGEIMHRTVDLSGNEEVYVKAGSTFTRMKASGTQLSLSYGDNHTITINGTMVQISYEGSQVVTVDSGKIDLLHSSGAHVLLDSTGVHNTFGSHFVNITAAGVQMG